MEKVFRILNGILDRMTAVLFVLTLLCGGYGMLDSCLVYRRADDPSLLRYKPLKEDERMEVRLEGSTGWLSIDDTLIDCPIMQGKDNTEYLNKDPYGMYSLAGSVFLDCSNSPDYSDSYNLVYGHHMNGDRMFGRLDDFLNPSYFARHKEGTLVTSLHRYSIHFIYAGIRNGEERELFDVRWTNSQKVLKAAGLDEKAGDHLLALSTCRNLKSTERIFLLGVLEY